MELSILFVIFLLVVLFCPYLPASSGIRASGCVCDGLSGHGRRGLEVEKPIRERDLRDIENEELRRQVQQLQQELARLQPLRHDPSHQGSEDEVSNDEREEFNPFHHEPSPEPNLNIAHRTFEFRREPFNIKVEISKFEGRAQLDEFIDWLLTVEWIFEHKDVLEHRKVKIVAIKLKKHASIWWEHLKKQRAHEGKSRIETWEKMKKVLKKKFLLDNYRQYTFLKFHN